MKIAILIDLLRSKGGGPRQVLELARELQNLGHTVTLFAYHFDRSETYTNLLNGLDVRSPAEPLTARPPRSRSILSRISAYLRYLFDEFYRKPKQFADLVQEPYDVFNLHEWPANRVAPFLRRRWPQARIVWMCNDVWHLPAGGTLTNPADKPWQRLVTLLLHVPALTLDWLATRPVQRITVLDHRIERIVVRHYRRPATVVRSGANLEQLAGFIDHQAQTTIYQRHGLPAGCPTVLCASIYFPHRRFEDVVRSVSLLRPKHPGLRLLIVGSTKFDQAYARSIDALIDAQGLRSFTVQVKEFVPDAELYRYYQAATVFVFANSHQTWGLAPIEAMVLGKPVVVTRGAGVHEVIRNRETGIVAEPENPVSLAESIGYLLDHPDERARIAARGQRFARDTFSWRKYAEQMFATFQTPGRP